MRSPGVNFRKVALALTLAGILTPNAYAAADSQNEPECRKDDAPPIVSSEQQPNGHKWIKAKVFIKATPHVVWETVHEERRRDPDLAYSKVLKAEENQATLEQKFALLPVIGTATCVMRNTEIPNQRIDYSMISSDRFKALEGRWVLSPERNGTSLELSSYCDMGLPMIPRSMIDGVMARKLQRRLTNVKAMAEATQTRLAHNHKLD